MPHSTCLGTSNIVATTFLLDVDAKQRPKHVRVLLSQKFGHLVASQKEVDCYGLLTLCKKPLNEALADSIRVPLEVCDIIVTLLKRGTRVLHNGKKKSRMVAKATKKGVHVCTKVKSKEDTVFKIRSSVVPEEFSA